MSRNFFSTSAIGRLSDDEVAADIEEDVVQAAFDALGPEAFAIDLAVAVEGGDEDGRGVGLDGRVDEFVLADHHPEVRHLEPGFGKVGVEDLVADRVAVGADDAENDVARDSSAVPFFLVQKRPQPLLDVEQRAALDLVIEGDDDAAPFGEGLEGGQVLPVFLQGVAGRDDDRVERGDELVQAVELGDEQRFGRLRRGYRRSSGGPG